MSSTKNTARSGVYQIRCLVSPGKVNIGSAVHIADRWSAHRRILVKGAHDSRQLQHAWNKYRADQFVWEILAFVENKEHLIQVEQMYLDKVRPFDRDVGYNTCPVAGSALGCKRSPEVRAKISAETARRMQDPEARARIGVASARRMQDTEARAKMAAAHARRMQDPEVRAKISAGQLGKILSPERRAKMAAAKVGRNLRACKTITR